jgi:hypothetical protein
MLSKFLSKKILKSILVLNIIFPLICDYIFVITSLSEM